MHSAPWMSGPWWWISVIELFSTPNVKCKLLALRASRRHNLTEHIRNGTKKGVEWKGHNRFMVRGAYSFFLNYSSQLSKGDPSSFAESQKDNLFCAVCPQDVPFFLSLITLFSLSYIYKKTFVWIWVKRTRVFCDRRAFVTRRVETSGTFIKHPAVLSG